MAAEILLLELEVEAGRKFLVEADMPPEVVFVDRFLVVFVDFGILPQEAYMLPDILVVVVGIRPVAFAADLQNLLLVEQALILEKFLDSPLPIEVVVVEGK